MAKGVANAYEVRSVAAGSQVADRSRLRQVFGLEALYVDDVC